MILFHVIQFFIFYSFDIFIILLLAGLGNASWRPAGANIPPKCSWSSGTGTCPRVPSSNSTTPRGTNSCARRPAHTADMLRILQTCCAHSRHVANTADTLHSLADMLRTQQTCWAHSRHVANTADMLRTQQTYCEHCRHVAHTADMLRTLQTRHATCPQACARPLDGTNTRLKAASHDSQMLVTATYGAFRRCSTREALQHHASQILTE